jgi:OOP family OmpA-OmpF porin
VLLVGVLLLGVLGTLLGARPAHAQRSFYLDRVQIGGAPDDGLVTRRPYLHPETRVYGSLSLGYVLDPLRASTVAATDRVEQNIENLIQQQLMGYFSGGVEIAGRVSLGLSVPVAFAQSGGQVPIAGARITPSLFPVDTGPALYDVSLETRVLVYNDDANKFRLGVGGAVFVPSGNFSRGGSDNRVTFYLNGAVEKGLGPFLVVGGLGPHFRPLRGIGGTDSRLDVGSELRINAALFLDLFNERLRVGGELNGQIGIDEDENGESTFFDAPATPFEWLGSARLLLGSAKRTYLRASLGTRFTNGYGAPDLRVMLSIGRWVLLDDLMPEDTTRVRFRGEVDVGKPPPDKDSDNDGFPDAIDACPEQAEDGQDPYPGDGCPVNSDRDGDGVPDLQDKCPEEPEDLDKLKDDDGCPETDADGDGVLDVRDACPSTPGIEQGDPKRDGCSPPPKKLVFEEGKDELKLLEPVQFETGTAEIKTNSFTLLDEVVAVLADHPEIRMSVLGHTDNKGSPGYNRELSQRRAQAVVKYLADKGIAVDRLEAKGFGPDRPVATNATPEGRAQNRRVEFKVLQPAP